ncbi:MAG: HNH endonuclease [Bacillota bacterium]
MSWKPKRPCSHPGCPELTDGRFCEPHAKQEHRRYNKYERDPESSKRYGRKWRKIRNRYISLHPLCEQCLKEDVLTRAEEVHHIKPLAQGGTHDDENLMALCKPCHSRSLSK